MKCIFSSCSNQLTFEIDKASFILGILFGVIVWIWFFHEKHVCITFQPLNASCIIYATQYQNFDFKLRKDHRKNFLCAPRLWVGRRCNSCIQGLVISNLNVIMIYWKYKLFFQWAKYSFIWIFSKLVWSLFCIKISVLLLFVLHLWGKILFYLFK